MSKQCLVWNLYCKHTFQTYVQIITINNQEKMMFPTFFFLLMGGVFSTKIAVLNFPRSTHQAQPENFQATLPPVNIDRLAFCVRYKLSYRYHKVQEYSSFFQNMFYFLIKNYTIYIINI